MFTQSDLGEMEAIRQLKARYFRLLDTQNWAEWRRIFTDDVEIKVDHTVTTATQKGDGPPLPRGADAFVEHISGFLTGAVTVHHGHMHEVTLTGPNSATGIVAMEDMIRIPGHAELHGYGHYHDEYRKEPDGEWRIARSHLVRLRVDHGVVG